jgi:hypothetical protein
MPTISIFFGIVVQMYWRDHSPPHIHAFYQSDEALLAIEDGRLIAGRMPRSGLRLMRDWIEQNRDALMENWERGRQRLPFEQIPGADDYD